MNQPILMRVHGDERDSLLARAGALRQQGQLADALDVLAQLENLHPRFSRLHLERAQCLVACADAHGAVAALEQALQINPALPAAWSMLEQLRRLSGQTDDARQAADNLALLEQLPTAVVVANSLYADGALSAAEEVIQTYLEAEPGNIGAARLLARIRLDRGKAAEAERMLAKVIDQAPDYHAARLDYAMALLQQQKHQKARQQAEILLALAPGHREYLKQFCAASIGLGDHEAVIDLLAQLIADPEAPAAEVAELYVWRANALKVAGRQQEAIADYRAALAAHEDCALAWFSLANLKTFRFTPDDIASMRAAERRSGRGSMDRIYMCFALGKAMEDRQRYAVSWRYYELGNALRRQSARYRPEVAEACANRLKAVCTSAFFADRADWGLDDTAPIFVVGLPRSGSTLVEQILASHSLIEGTQELTEIARYAAQICGADPDCGLPLDPANLLRLHAGDVRCLAKQFLAETQAYRRLGRPFFIDKMPNNFWHIALIHLMLPHATIIDVRRAPMACCFSNLKQLFGTINQEFTYDTQTMARHYRIYLDVMRHWDQVLPGRVLRLFYEDLVEDLEGNVRRLLDHGGWAFEEACLRFYETRRSIRTPSSEQVRTALGREGLARWSHYEPWLGGLREALGDAVTRYRD